MSGLVGGLMGVSGVAGAVFTRSTTAALPVSTASLAAPTSLAFAGSALSWTATSSTFASGTRVYRSTVSGGPYSQIAQVTPRTTTTYTDSPGAGTFYYVVAAYYSGNGASWTSANSNQVAKATCSAPGTVTVANPILDAFTNESAPTTAYGTAQTLEVDNKVNNRKYAYIKFTLPAVPAGCVVTEATLTTYFTVVGANKPVIDVYTAGAAWTETVKWTGQPDVSGTPTSGAPQVKDLAFSWAVGSQIQAMYAGANNGFVLRAASGTTASNDVFGSRENTTAAKRETLAVTFG